MRSLCILAVLGCFGIHVAAAKPSRKHAKPQVNLALTPSTADLPTAGLDVSPEVPPEEGRGAYMGHRYIDAETATSLRVLPARVRRRMAQPVGPEPMFFRGAVGAGLYARY